MDSLSELAAGADRLIDPQRLWSTIMEIARIGAIPGGGSCRLSLSDEDRQARDLFASWCLEAGCDVRVDPYGNMFAVRAGKGAGQPSILIGSHLDTQPHGGRFDGVLGVLAGLEIVRTLNDRGIVTERPVVVVNWTNEEGVRFKPGLTGSAGFAGYLDPAAVTGSDGEDFFAELRRTGYAGTAREGLPITSSTSSRDPFSNASMPLSVWSKGSRACVGTRFRWPAGMPMREPRRWTAGRTVSWRQRRSPSTCAPRR